MVIEWVTNGLKSVHGYHDQNVRTVMNKCIILCISIGIKNKILYLRYGPNIPMNFMHLQIVSFQGNFETAVMTSSGKRVENVTMISVMNKCTRK